MKKILKPFLLLVFLLLATCSNVLADSTVPAAYKSTINFYRENLYAGTYDENTYGAIMIADHYYDEKGDDAINFVGYDVDDINGDGIQELLFGYAETPTTSIIALYTLVNESPVMVAKQVASPLSQFNIIGNVESDPQISNTVAFVGQLVQHDNSNYYTDKFYKLNGTDLEFVESYTVRYIPSVECYKSTDENNPFQTLLGAEVPEALSTAKREFSMTPLANYVDIPEQGPEGSIYRVCNVTTNEHLYTLWHNEAVELCKSGAWRNEGIAWTAPNTSDTPIYRLYNADLNDHLYTSDPNEVRILTTEQNWAADNNSQPVFYSGGDIPIYRLYNLTNYRHLLTRDDNEYNILPQFGWTQEGTALYAVS